MVSIAVQTAVVDVMISGEFCNMRRRIAHLLTMYGFVIYVVTTIIMVFAYPTPATPAPNLTALWYVGALMVCLGGYWFWFFIRVDVVAEGNSPFRFIRADLFIVSLVLSVTFGLAWAYVQTTGNATLANVLLTLYLLATTVLFGSIPWSKFSHMFFKPAAAMQKRVAEANGTRSNLPAPADGCGVVGQHPVGPVDDHEDRDRKLTLGDDGELGQAHLQRSVSDEGQDGVAGGHCHAHGHRQRGPHGQVSGEGVVATGDHRQVFHDPEAGLRHVDRHQWR